MSRAADIVVVGGGVIGLSCAWRLSQRGLRVLVCERGACGNGASGAALGVLMPAAATRRGPVQRLQRQSLSEFAEFSAALQARTGIDVGYRRCGLIEVLSDDGRRGQALGEARIACAEWPAAGDGPVMELLSCADATRLAPDVKFSELGARLCRSTAKVDAGALVAALRAACLADGVTIQERCVVHEIAVRDGRAQGVLLDDGCLEGDAVLAAAGAWTGQLNAPLAKFATMRPVRGQTILLRASRVRLTHIVKQGGIYLVPREDGTILLGATTEPDSGYRAHPTAEGFAELMAAGLRLVPGLAEAQAIYAGAGLRPVSEHGQPVLGGIPGIAGLYVAAGHYKTGIGLAAVTGRVMAELIADGAATVDLAPFAPHSPDAVALFRG